ncbi:uncharacterized protein PG998_005243 [Apiospora kogelbergensis]|uniref:uncharacterized protein n=1 Tax=Apiospora kogelbergensis TaxID=1337665 RepID=UPI00312E7FC1
MVTEMAAAPCTVNNREHPLRYACDRCHFHKLRCSRTDQRVNGNPDTDEPCSRCRKAQVLCVQGVRGKVGRPSKSLKRKAVECEETHSTRNNGALDDAGCESRHDAQDRRQHTGRYRNQHSEVGLDEQLPATDTNLSIATSDIDSEESPRPTSRLCHPSPLPYQTPAMTAFPITTGEVGNWETLMVHHDDFATGFVPSFDLDSFRTPSSHACFQGPSVATAAHITNGSEQDVLDCSSGAMPLSLTQYINTTAAMDSYNTKQGVSSNGQPPLAGPLSGRQVPTPAPSILPVVCTRESYETLSDLNLRINAVMGRSELDTSPNDAKILKDASSLASNLIDIARQIIPELAKDASISDEASAASQNSTKRDQEMAPFESPVNGSITSNTTRSEWSHGNPRRRQRYNSASGLVFMLLACYSGVLCMFELVVDELWTRHGAKQRGGGATTTDSVHALLETSLAVHTVNYLLKLLREAMFPGDPSRCLGVDPVLDGSDGWCGGSSSSTVGVGGVRGMALGLLRTTCTEMLEREQRLLRRTQHLQQLLVS